jgi:hypothetical protein
MNRTIHKLPFALLAMLALGACSGGASSSHGPGGAGNGGGAGAQGAAGTNASGAAGSAAGATGAAGDNGPAGSTGAAGATAGSGPAGTSGGAGSAAGASGGAGAAGSAGMTGGNPDGSADALPGVHPFPSTQTVKLMVVGSSNEIGTCWRAYLWQDLHMDGITNFDFVGQQMGGPSCTVMGWNDTQLQAMSGIIITGIPLATYLGWFKANPPDVILMHFGGADILAGMPVDGVMKAYGTALMAARMVNPKVVLLIAQHSPEGKPDILTLNADIAAWAPTVSTADSPVRVVDLYTDITAADQSDGVHFNQAGSIKVAMRFLAALEPFFKP